MGAIRGEQRGPYKRRSKEELDAKERLRRRAFVGTPLTSGEILRFRAMINENGPVVRPELGPCFLWTGTVSAGYGHFMMRSRVTGSFESIPSHRIAFWIANGRPPNGVARHQCDNRRCCNGSHVVEGTYKDNAGDAIARGRFAFPASMPGELNASAKLTESDVLEIRTRAASGESSRALGASFGVTHATVQRVARGASWRHVK